MAKKESTFPNMLLTLFLVTFISAAILGFVQDLTKDAIAEANLKAQNDAIKTVLPEYDKLGDSLKLPSSDGGDSLEFYPAYNASNELIATAIKSYSKNGFGGLIQIMVGITPDGTICGYEVLKHEETPGLGSKMTTWFKNPEKPNQDIIGKNPETTNFTVSKDGGDIDAITASTITSRAFLEAVRRAYNTYSSNKMDSNASASNKDETQSSTIVQAERDPEVRQAETSNMNAVSEETVNSNNSSVDGNTSATSRMEAERSVPEEERRSSERLTQTDTFNNVVP